MSSWDEQFLKLCPYCNGKVTDHSYDRRIVFKCEPCSLYKDYPGLYIELGPEHIRVYQGAYMIETAKLDQLRKYIAKNLTAFNKLVMDKKFIKHFSCYIVSFGPRHTPFRYDHWMIFFNGTTCTQQRKIFVTFNI